jgi:hypothetical protein
MCPYSDFLDVARIKIKMKLLDEWMFEETSLFFGENSLHMYVMSLYTRSLIKGNVLKTWEAVLS